jgi:hypothetical protein
MTVDAATFRRSLKIVTLAAAAAGWAATVRAADAEDPGRVRRAIGYLDARQDAWSKFARAERGEGASKTTCVSCHTALGYVLGRPALGQFTAAPETGLAAAESGESRPWLCAWSTGPSSIRPNSP